MGRGRHGTRVASRRSVLIRGVRQVPPMVVTVGYQPVLTAARYGYAAVLGVDPLHARGVGVI